MGTWEKKRQTVLFEMSFEIGTGVQAIVCCHERFEITVSIKKKAVLHPSDDDDKTVAIPSRQDQDLFPGKQRKNHEHKGH